MKMEIDLNELQLMAESARDKSQGYCRKCREKAKNISTLDSRRHYTTFDDYHICIDGDGALIQMNDFEEVLSATYHRNTGSVAIALCCCADAVAYADGTYDLGEYPPTTQQIESMAQCVATLCTGFDIPIDIEHVMTHAEAANNQDGVYCHEPYGPGNGCERWDLAVLEQGDNWMSGGDIIRRQGNFLPKPNVILLL